VVGQGQGGENAAAVVIVFFTSPLWGGRATTPGGRGGWG
jgi:hypothetical protein